MDTIPFASIKVNLDTNARKKYHGIEALAEDIKVNGLINPLTVFQYRKNGQWHSVLRAGFRRYFAIQHIRKHDKKAFREVPVIKRRGNDLDAAFVNLAENIRRQDLTPGEIAERVYALTLEGVSQNEISRRIGLSSAYVSLLMKCKNTLDPKVFAMLVSGEIPVDLALKLTKSSASKQVHAVDRFLTNRNKNGKSAARIANGISRPGVKKLLSVIDEIAESKDESDYWAGVVHGLEFAAGKRKRFGEK